MKLLSGFLVLAVASFLPARPSQQSSGDAKQTREDPGGWNKAKWGMTDAELMGAFEGKAIRTKGKPWGAVDEDLLGVEAWRIGETDYHILFVPDENGKLKAVQLSPHSIPGPPVPPLPRGIKLTPPMISPPVFNPLNVMLTEKYGKPDAQTNKTQEGVTIEEARWQQFPVSGNAESWHVTAIPGHCLNLLWGRRCGRSHSSRCAVGSRRRNA